MMRAAHRRDADVRSPESLGVLCLVIRSWTNSRSLVIDCIPHPITVLLCISFSAPYPLLYRSVSAGGRGASFFVSSEPNTPRSNSVMPPIQEETKPQQPLLASDLSQAVFTSIRDPGAPLLLFALQM